MERRNKIIKVQNDLILWEMRNVTNSAPTLLLKGKEDVGR